MGGYLAEAQHNVYLDIAQFAQKLLEELHLQNSLTLQHGLDVHANRVTIDFANVHLQKEQAVTQKFATEVEDLLSEYDSEPYSDILSFFLGAHTAKVDLETQLADEFHATANDITDDEAVRNLKYIANTVDLRFRHELIGIFYEFAIRLAGASQRGDLTDAENKIANKIIRQFIHAYDAITEAFSDKIVSSAIESSLLLKPFPAVDAFGWFLEVSKPELDYRND